MFRKLYYTIGASFLGKYMFSCGIPLVVAHARMKKQTPIMVYQMGKVGSQGVQTVLRKSKLGIHIFHVHFMISKNVHERLNKLDVISASTRAYYNKSACLGTFIQQHPHIKWNIVTVVREPVARNISALFHDFNTYVPEEESKDIPNLSRILQEKYPKDEPFMWFEKELQEVFDINILQHPFPKTKGFQIIETKRANILLIKLEHLQSCAEQAFKEFLGIPNFTPIRKNSGQEKEYKELYMKCKSEITLPTTYLDNIYDDKYVKHFYTEEEINNFKQHWRYLS